MCLHIASFYFLLGIASTLSAISVHEFYKVHFYRDNVKLVHRVLLLLHFIFFVLNIVDFFFHDKFSIPFAHISLLIFLIIGNIMNYIYIKVLVEVNEHKNF